MSPSPRPLGRWLLVEPLGAGGMSEVDLARAAGDPASPWVAIKRIHGSATADAAVLRMFRDEARIGAQLDHPGIARVLESGRDGDELYLVMEYVPGFDLREVARRCQSQGMRIPLRMALTFVLRVLEALAYAHGRTDRRGRPLGIVHRDVNPRNVMVSARGEVKLIDFGVALAVDRLEKTEAGKVKGKLVYMSPEQLEARPDVDARADLFAVGLLLTELVNGQSPLAGLTELQAVHRILQGRVGELELPEDHPARPGLQALQQRALSVRREDRFRDAQRMAEALREGVALCGGEAAPDEIAAFLRGVCPEGVDRMAARLRERDVGPLRGDGSATFGTPGRGLGGVSWPWWAGPAALGLGLILALGLLVGVWTHWVGAQTRPVSAPPPVVTLAPPSRRPGEDADGLLSVDAEEVGVPVTLDGQPLGRTPIVGRHVPAGRHLLEVGDGRGGVRTSREVVVLPGQPTEITIP